MQNTPELTLLHRCSGASAHTSCLSLIVKERARILKPRRTDNYTRDPIPLQAEKDEETGFLGPPTYIERSFTFLAVTYWRSLPERMPGLFRNPIDGDAVAFAERGTPEPVAELTRFVSMDEVPR